MEHGKAIASMKEFIEKWGTVGWKIPIKEFIERSPEFRGDVEIAKIIGEVVADLETAIRNSVAPR